MLWRVIAIVALCGWALTVGYARAQPVDLNIVTAIDTSGSIDPSEEDMQYRGLAQAVVDDLFLQRVAEGDFGAVGFMAYTWSENRAVVVVPWTIIRNRADAEAVAAVFDAIPRTSREDQYSPRELTSPYIGLATRIGECIQRGLAYLEASPFLSKKAALNVLSDGESDDDPSLARAAAAAQGVTVNGVVFGLFPDELKEYFEANIITGTGAFVVTVNRPFDFPAPFERKFWQDMLALREAL